MDIISNNFKNIREKCREINIMDEGSSNLLVSKVSNLCEDLVKEETS
jgi:hypothetical protein